MASKLTYKRTTTDKVTVKGVLSADGTYITYEDEKKRHSGSKNCRSSKRICRLPD